MDDAILELVVLDSIWKQAMGNKTVSSIPPSPLHQFLPLGSCPVWIPASQLLMMSCYMEQEQNKSFHLKLLLVMLFHHSNRDPKTDGAILHYGGSCLLPAMGDTSNPNQATLGGSSRYPSFFIRYGMTCPLDRWCLPCKYEKCPQLSIHCIIYCNL